MQNKLNQNNTYFGYYFYFYYHNCCKAQTTSIAEKTKNMTTYNGYKLLLGWKYG
jgi:hypothetical protein